MPRPDRQIEIVCHKGANEYAPENTYVASQLCLDWGMDYVEVDVNLSKDGVHYLLHGPDIDQTTDGSGPFRALTSAAIDRLDAGSWFDPRFAGEQVPRLEPFLAWIKGKAKVFLDVKAANLEQLIHTIYRMGLERECFFWFGQPDMAHQFRQLDRQLLLKVNVSNVTDLREAVDLYQANIVEVRLKDMSAALHSACRRFGLKLMIYQPEKDVEAFRRIIEWDVDLVNLNHGDLFAALLAEQTDRR